MLDQTSVNACNISNNSSFLQSDILNSYCKSRVIASNFVYEGMQTPISHESELLKSTSIKICSTDENLSKNVNCESYPVPPPLRKLDQPKLKINILGGDSIGIKKEQASQLFISNHLVNNDKKFESVYMSQTTKATVAKGSMAPAITFSSRKNTCDTEQIETEAAIRQQLAKAGILKFPININAEL